MRKRLSAHLYTKYHSVDRCCTHTSNYLNDEKNNNNELRSISTVFSFAMGIYMSCIAFRSLYFNCDSLLSATKFAKLYSLCFNKLNVTAYFQCKEFNRISFVIYSKRKKRGGKLCIGVRLN